MQGENQLHAVVSFSIGGAEEWLFRPKVEIMNQTLINIHSHMRQLLA